MGNAELRQGVAVWRRRRAVVLWCTVVAALTGPVLSLVVASGNSVNAEVTALLD